jgi:hypothetical protein
MKQMGNAWWGVDGYEKRFNGQAQAQTEMDTNPDFFQMVWDKCLTSNKGDAVGVSMGSEEGLGGGTEAEEREAAALAATVEDDGEE